MPKCDLIFWEWGKWQFMETKTVIIAGICNIFKLLATFHPALLTSLCLCQLTELLLSSHSSRTWLRNSGTCPRSWEVGTDKSEPTTSGQRLKLKPLAAPPPEIKEKQQRGMVKAGAFFPYFPLSLPWVALVIPSVPDSSFVNSNSLFPRMLWQLII